MPDFNSQASEIAIRFQRDSEWSVSHRDGDVYVWRIHAPSERAVDLFMRLSSQLDTPVDVVIEHLRDGTSWFGGMRPLAEVRDALGRLRWPLASSGGVELTFVTPDDQLSLMPTLDLVIYARGDRWAAVLEAEGVLPRESAPPPLWNPSRAPWSPAPDLSAALAALVQRLELEPGA